MGVYAAVRREARRGVGAVLRPCTASSTGSRRGSDVLVTILDRPCAVVTRTGGRERRQYEYYGVLLWCVTSKFNSQRAKNATSRTRGSAPLMYGCMAIHHTSAAPGDHAWAPYIKNTSVILKNLMYGAVLASIYHDMYEAVSYINTAGLDA